MKYSKQEREEALAKLRELCPPGTTVYTKLNHVSRSGMSRSITPFLIVDGEPRYITWSVAVLFGQSRDKYDGLKIDGCNMDMGFHLVYNLSHYLYPDGFCPSSEAVAPADMEIAGKVRDLSFFRGRRAGPMSREEVADKYARGWRFLHGRNGDTSGWDLNGGYALNQRWI